MAARTVRSFQTHLRRCVGSFKMLLPHGVQLAQLGAEILEGEAGLGLAQFAGGQQLLQRGHGRGRLLLPLPPVFLLHLFQLLSQLADRLLVFRLAQAYLIRILICPE